MSNNSFVTPDGREIKRQAAIVPAMSWLLSDNGLATWAAPIAP
jgi:hypothetical protein